MSSLTKGAVSIKSFLSLYRRFRFGGHMGVDNIHLRCGGVAVEPRANILRSLVDTDADPVRVVAGVTRQRLDRGVPQYSGMGKVGRCHYNSLVAVWDLIRKERG